MLFVMNMSLSLPVIHAAPENNPQRSSKEILGTLQLFPSSDSNGSSVIFIQDAHANFEAQARIRDILKEITPSLRTQTILVEGTSLGLNPEVFKLTSSNELNKKIANRLAKKGLVTGAELFTLEPESSGIQFSGLEDEALYQKEREAFKTVIRLKRDTKRAVSVLDSRLETFKARIFNPTLKDLDRKFTAYEKGRLAILGWFDSLREMVIRELGFSLNDPAQAKEYPNLVRLAVSVEASKKLDPEKLETEKKKIAASFSDRANFVRFIQQLGTEKEKKDSVANNKLAYELYLDSAKHGVNWLEYPEIRKALAAMLLSGELAGEGLFREMERLKDGLYSHLAQSEKEKEAIILDKDLRLMKDALSLESTRDIWNEIKARKNDIGPQAWLSRFKKIDVTTNGVDSKLIAQAESAFENSVAFYEFAEKRERVFMERIQSALGQKSGSSVIVIGGGFHTEGLKQSCEENNMTLAVIQPRLGGKSDITNYYRAVFESASLPFAASKMSAKPAAAKERFISADPEQPGAGAQAQKSLILEEIEKELKAGTLRVTDVESLNRSFLFKSLGARAGEVTGSNRIAVYYGSAQSLGSDRMRKVTEWDALSKTILDLSGEKIDLSRLMEDQVEANAIFDRDKKAISIHGGEGRYRIIAGVKPSMFEVVEAILEANELPADFRNRLDIWVRTKYPEEWPFYLSAKLRTSEAVPEEKTGLIAPPASGRFDISAFRTAEKPKEEAPAAVQVEDLTTERIAEILSEKNIRVTLGKGTQIEVAPRSVLDQFISINTSGANPVAVNLLEGSKLILKFGNVKINESMTMQPNAVLEIAPVSTLEPVVSMAMIQFGKAMLFENKNAIRIGDRATVFFSDNAVMNGLDLNVQKNRAVMFQQNTAVSGKIVVQALPEAEFTMQALVVGADSEVTFDDLTIGPQSKIIPQSSGLKGMLPPVFAHEPQTYFLQPQPGSANKLLQLVSSPRPITQGVSNVVPDVPQIQAGSLGTQPPAVLPNRIAPQPPQIQNLPQNLNPLPDTQTATPAVNIPSAPRFSDLPPAVVNNPRIPPVTPLVPGLTFNDTPGTPEDFRTFVEAFRASVRPLSSLTSEEKQPFAQEIDRAPTVYTDLFTSTGIIAVPSKAPGETVVSWPGILAKVSEPARVERLSRLIHDLRNQRVAVNIGVSDPEGFYSLNNEAYRQSIADVLEKNKNLVVRIVHLGPESDLAKIREFFVPYGERFAVVGATSLNWESQLHGQMGDELLQTVQRLDAGKQIHNLKELYSGKHIAVILTDDRWQAARELPMTSILKVRSSAKTKSLASKLSKDPNGITYVSALEATLAELWSLREGNYREITDLFPEDVLTFSEGRIGLNTQTLLQARIEEIQQFMLAIEKLAYQA